MSSWFPPPPGLGPNPRLEVVPMLLVKGVAPDGREHNLQDIAEWMLTLGRAELLAFFKQKEMPEQQVLTFWQWSGRQLPAPKSLRIYLKVNERFRDWVLLQQAGEFIHAKKPDLPLDRLGDMLTRAFANGHIVTRGIPQHDARGEIIAMHQLELKTRDLVRWLDYELDIKTTVNELVCWPKDSITLDALMQPRKKRK